MVARERLIARHRAAFGLPPRVLASAPGRVNLIGEHTDYNDGFVMPMAIDRRVWAAASPGPPGRLELLAADLDERRSLDLARLAPPAEHGWTDYPAGMAWVLGQAGVDLPGVCLSVAGDVPQGAGLSSSAALEVACGLALTALAAAQVSGVDLARMAQEAEHTFAGVRCGIMDQFISRLAVEGQALLIDCRSLDHRPVPLGADLAVVITDTRVPHKLSQSAYNERRAQCQAGVAALQRLHPGTALRDYSLADLAGVTDLAPPVRDRCQHVIAENARVLKAERALRAGDLPRFGELINASHDSLRDRYQVSCPELDWLVERARTVAGVLGARMTGAGFGGSTVSLCRPEAVAAYRAAIGGYADRFGREAAVLVSRPAPGAGLSSLPVSES